MMQQTDKASPIIIVRTSIRTGLSIAGFLIAITVLGEYLLRLLVPSHNYLTPKFSYHDKLGYHIKPFHAGHDGWGFRNEGIPGWVDTVTIGDSFTYGTSVSASDAWPSVLADKVNQPIYNLSLGGYGVMQYQHLLETYATKLNPRQVIVGLYLGDDIAVRISQPNEKGNIQHSPVQPRFNLRHWLAENSFLYHVVVQSPVGNWVRFIENWWLSNEPSSDRYIFFNSTANRTIFTPKSRLRNLDLTRERNQTGLEKLKSVILEMERFCRTQNIIFKVAVFPTKERVYMDQYLSGDSENYPVMNQLFAAEDGVRKQLTRFLDQHHIEHLDLLTLLAQENRKSRLFFQDANGHMAREGHKVAAKGIKNELF